MPIFKFPFHPDFKMLKKVHVKYVTSFYLVTTHDIFNKVIKFKLKKKKKKDLLQMV